MTCSEPPVGDRGALDIGIVWHHEEAGTYAVQCVCPERCDPPWHLVSAGMWPGERFDASGVAGEPADPANAVAAGVVVRGGRWWAERTSVGGGVRRATGMTPVRPFVSAPAYVRAEFGLTLHTGDFEFARVNISLSMPCYPSEIDMVRQDVAEWVARTVIEERDELTHALGVRVDGEGDEGGGTGGEAREEAPPR